MPPVVAAPEASSGINGDGPSGRPTPVGHPESLAAAINDLPDDPFERSRLGRDALLAARPSYSLARTAGDAERVYHEVPAGAWRRLPSIEPRTAPASHARRVGWPGRSPR